MLKLKQTNPYAIEDHHIYVLSDPHKAIWSTGATEMYTTSERISDYTVQSSPNSWHSHGEIRLPCAGVVPKKPREYRVSSSQEAAEADLF